MNGHEKIDETQLREALRDEARRILGQTPAVSSRRDRVRGRGALLASLCAAAAVILIAGGLALLQANTHQPQPSANSVTASNNVLPTVTVTATTTSTSAPQSPERTLFEHRWQLMSLTRADGATVPLESANIDFAWTPAPDDTVLVVNGCTSAKVQVQATRQVFRSQFVTSTNTSTCVQMPDIDTNNLIFGKILQGSMPWSIDATTLTLGTADGRRLVLDAVQD